MYLQKINLKNKYALVTGAGKGLGRACSIALAEAGATVIALSRTQSDLNRLEKDIKKIKGKIIKIECDVMNYQDLKEKLNKIKIIDILVNNAGTNIPEPFEKIKQTSMNYLVDLNLKAAFNVAQLVVKIMLKNKKRPGSIINMSSQLGHVGMIGRNVYNMTKFGIEGLTKQVDFVALAALAAQVGLDADLVRSANSVLQVVDMATAEQRRRLADVIASAARMTAVKTLRDAPVVVEIMVVGRDGTCWGTAGG